MVTGSPTQTVSGLMKEVCDFTDNWKVIEIKSRKRIRTKADFLCKIDIRTELQENSTKERRSSALSALPRLNGTTLPVDYQIANPHLTYVSRS
jgi:hypothetical protein